MMEYFLRPSRSIILLKEDSFRFVVFWKPCKFSEKNNLSDHRSNKFCKFVWKQLCFRTTAVPEGVPKKDSGESGEEFVFSVVTMRQPYHHNYNFCGISRFILATVGQIQQKYSGKYCQGRLLPKTATRYHWLTWMYRVQVNFSRCTNSE